MLTLLHTTSRRVFIIILLICLLYSNAFSQRQNDSLSQSKIDTTFYPGRFAFVVSTASVGLIGSYIYVQKAWWSDQSTSFHFDQGMDYRYAMNLDKAAHFIGGSVFASFFKAGFQWSGANEKNACIYGFIMGSVLQLSIELKDGFAPTYGFSIGDISAGIAGSTIPLLKYKYPKLDALNFKFSYWKHDDFFFKQFGTHADFIDDYMNQTYWLSLTVNDWLPKGSKVEKFWPDFLCIVGGWGVDNTLDWYNKGVNLDENKGKGNHELYLSLDVDWRKIIPQKTNFKKSLATVLNYVKLPLPTLRLTPYPIYYWGFL